LANKKGANEIAPFLFGLRWLQAFASGYNFQALL
jgi:hypothetical protein